jgi:hypothetical protein
MSPRKTPSAAKRPRRPIPRPKPIDPKRRPKPTKFKLSRPAKKALAEVDDAGGKIVKEILFEVEFVITTAGKTLTTDAFQEFRPKLHVEGINKKLSKGGNWTADRVRVLSAATQMGGIAVVLAGLAPKVAKVHIHNAFYAVKNGSTVCTNPGSGSWCDFFI